jgi:hypothetical protein
MTDLPARRKTRTPLLLLGAAVAVALTIFIYFKFLEQRRWKQVERRVAQLRAEADARFRPRPVLRGTAVPGDAWEDYRPAIDLVAKMEEYSTLQMYSVSSGEPRFDSIRNLLQEYAPAVDGMQRGTRRAEVRRVRFDEQARYSDDDALRPIMTLGHLAACRARWLAAEGRTREATELELDLCKYAQDVAADGSQIAFELSYSLTSVGLVGLEYLLTQGGLAAEDCRTMDRDLDLLDASFPRLGTFLLGKLEYFGSWMLKRGCLEELRGLGCVPRGAEVAPGWREAYSARLFLATAFDQTDALFAGLLPTDEGSLSDGNARREKATADLGDSGNWLYTGFTRNDRMPEASQFRSPRTRLRLLRAAAHWRATGEFLELDDPMGTKLSHSIVLPDKLKFWGEGDNSLEIQLRR